MARAIADLRGAAAKALQELLREFGVWERRPAERRIERFVLPVGPAVARSEAAERGPGAGDAAVAAPETVHTGVPVHEYSSVESQRNVTELPAGASGA